MPAPSAECQHPEAWPASTYGYLRGVSLTFQMLTFERISWFGGKGIGKCPLWFNNTCKFVNSHSKESTTTRFPESGAKKTESKPFNTEVDIWSDTKISWYSSRLHLNQHILSNVRRCWLAMHLVVGFLHSVLVCHTIEKQERHSRRCQGATNKIWACKFQLINYFFSFLQFSICFQVWSSHHHSQNWEAWREV